MPHPFRPNSSAWPLPSTRLLACFWLLTLFLVACQGNEAVADVVQTNPLPSATAVPPTLVPTATATLPPPAKVYVATAVQPTMPSFSLPQPTETAVAYVPPPTITPANTAESETAVEAATGPTATPQATFTSPALPQTSADDHYWLKRPVAEDGVVWTDKVYPYGSTRGGQLRPHHGVEFNVPYNTEILAAASGTVVVAGPDNEIVYGEHLNFYGNLVVIEHDSLYNGQRLFTLYGHLAQPLVAVGQKVVAEQVIGISGATGVADGPHMHFEVRLGQNNYQSTYNPLLWLWPFPDRGTVVGRIVYPDGSLAYEVPVRVERIDADSRYAATTSYAQGEMNADPVWNENFAIDDVAAGYYQVIVSLGNNKNIKQELWVYPRSTSFIEIVLTP